MRKIALSLAALAALSFVAVNTARAEDTAAKPAAKTTTMTKHHHKVKHHKAKPKTTPAPKS